jgi:hypothetical protein
MIMLLPHLLAIALGTGIAVVVNVLKKRRVVNPGVLALALVGVVAALETVLLTSQLSKRTMDPGAQGEVFGELVMGPALMAALICWGINRMWKRRGTEARA